MIIDATDEAVRRLRADLPWSAEVSELAPSHHATCPQASEWRRKP